VGGQLSNPATLRHERFPPEGRPWKLRTVALTTAEGSIEFSVMREHVYLAKDQEMREGFSSEVYPDVVLARDRKLGYESRHELLGFGLMNGRDRPPSLMDHLYVIAELEQGFGGKKMGWVEWRVVVWIPYWAVVLLTALPPLWALHLMARREKWRQAGKCLKCGYDLRGSGERCPECGEAKGTKIIHEEHEGVK